MSANAASRRVHEKLGFTSLGACLCPAPARGGDVPGELFRLGRGATHTAVRRAPPQIYLVVSVRL